MVDSTTTSVTADTTEYTADYVGAEASFSTVQYGQAARNLLPRGRAWNRQNGSNQAAFCDALGLIYAQQDADSQQMLADFFPATATQGIDEWNSSLGLPDQCSGAPATLAATQQQIVSRLTATGGQSIPYYTALAATLGYEISITEFSPTEPGSDAPPGLIVEAQDWASTWRVNILNVATAPTGGVTETRLFTVEDTDIEPLLITYTVTALQCLLNRYKPAHTQFYVVDGTSPTTATRLFDAADTVAEPLLITYPVR